MRLVGGRDQSEGTVQVYHNGWGTICDDSFDNKEATVICGMLGYHGWDTEFICLFYLRRNSSPVFWSFRVKNTSLLHKSLKRAGLGGSVGCAVRLETRRSRVQPPPRSATFFRGDWSWNIFYGHSLPSADSRRAVVSFWRKNVHNTG